MLTDDDHVLAALAAAKQEGATAVLVEIGANQILTIRVFLDDGYRRLLRDDELVAYEFGPSGLKKKDAPN